MVAKLDKDGFDEVLHAGNIPAVVDFMAPWCPYCKRLSPLIEEIAASNPGKIDVFYVDIDEQPELAERYEVMTIPTVFVFENGEARGSIVNPKTKESLLQLIF